MPWYEVGNAENLRGGTITEVKANNLKLCLVYNNGHYFATQLKCPHAGARLSNGWCEKGELICPVHRYRYNLFNGRGGFGQGDYIDVYQVKVQNGKVFVKVNSFKDRLKKLFGYGNKRD